MGVISEADLKRAEAAGKKMLRDEPRAAAARYDRKMHCVVIELVTGCSYTVPAALVQDLQEATPEELADVRVDGVGLNLHFPAIEVDLYVPALVAGVFGTKSWMARLARRSGVAGPPAAVRTRAAKAGRPRKAARG